MFFVQEGFTFRNFLLDALAIFVFIVWFWLLITVAADLFRRHDISGWIKAIWVIALIVFPFVAVFAYLIFQSRAMAERNSQQVQQSREDLRRVVGFRRFGLLVGLASCSALGAHAADELRDPGADRDGPRRALPQIGVLA